MRKKGLDNQSFARMYVSTAMNAVSEAKDAMHTNGKLHSAAGDALAAAYHDAARAHVATLTSGDDLAILHAYRAVLAAEAALYRDSGGRADLATAAAIDEEVSEVDREIDERSRRCHGGNQ